MMGMTRPIMSKVANNVFINGPGISITLKANIPTIEMKIYCPSRPRRRVSNSDERIHTTPSMMSERFYCL